MAWTLQNLKHSREMALAVNRKRRALSILHDREVVEHRALLEAGLARFCSAEHDRLAQIVQHALVPPGKLLRPLMCLSAAVAVGGDVAQVVPAAVGAEYVHVASLVHDDIIDGDEQRRGRPSAPHQFGTDDALVAGDALIAMGFRALAMCREAGTPPERIVAALSVSAEGGLAACRGQILEAGLDYLTCEIDDYMQMIWGKTAAPMRCGAQVGAILGGGTPEQVAALGDYGDALGLAFQIHDDLLPYLSESAITGKSAISDLRNRRPTLPVLLARQAGSAVRIRLEEIFADRCDPQIAHTRLADLLREAGAVAQAAETARRHVALAHQALRRLPPSRSRDRLGRFADFAVERDR